MEKDDSKFGVSDKFKYDKFWLGTDISSLSVDSSLTQPVISNSALGLAYLISQPPNLIAHT